MNNIKETDKKMVIASWRRIVMILHELGYDFMYQDDIDNVANFIREELIN